MKKLILLLLSLPALSAEKADQELESVIDRLEAKLDGQRSTVLEQYKIVRKNEPSLIPSSSQLIAPNLEETKKIDEISVATKKIEDELDQLADQVNSQAAQIQDDSKLLPRAKIVFQSPDANSSRAKFLRITLNDIPLYEYKIVNSSVPLPSSFSVYDGALPQGKHLLSIEGNWARLSDKLHFEDEVSWSVNKVIEIESTGTKSITHYALTALHPTSKNKGEILLKVGSQP